MGIIGEPPIDPRIMQTHSSDESLKTKPNPAPKSQPVVKVQPKRLAGREFIFDIGHGIGNRKPGLYDPGAVSHGQHEHKLIEAFVEDLADAFRAEGAHVVVSHDVPLTSRKVKASIDATSFHLDAAGATASGVTVFVPVLGSTKQSEKVGRAIAAAMAIPFRGVKRTRELAVINRGYDRLIECGFITNDTDRKRFVERKASIVAAVLNQYL